MAKWGEGDPRWLVEERPDAKNVNNWHWTEKNASGWSKTKFDELLIGLKVETDFARCEISEVSKCEGDAVVNNRKAKLILFYEWVLELKWSGTLVNGDSTASGTVHVPNLSEEHDMKDVDLTVQLDSSGPEADILKDVMRAKGCEVIRDRLGAYVAALRDEFSKGLILPTKDSAASDVVPPQQQQQSDATQLDLTAVSLRDKSVKDSDLATCELTTTESFKCTADEFYRAITMPELVHIFTRGNVKLLEPVEGGRFELFDGHVSGRFTRLVPDQIIEQTWRLRSWPSSHHSTVTMTIVQKSDCTEVCLKQAGVPVTELDNTREGWKRFYWESMRRTLGFGAMLF